VTISFWLGLSSVVSFEVESIIWGCGCIWKKVGIVGVSNKGSLSMYTSSVVIVLMGMKGRVVGSSDVVCVSGSWGNLCLFGSCMSSLVYFVGLDVSVYLFGAVHEGHFLIGMDQR
jgi:hypothetical protein